MPPLRRARNQTQGHRQEERTPVDKGNEKLCRASAQGYKIRKTSDLQNLKHLTFNIQHLTFHPHNT